MSGDLKPCPFCGSADVQIMEFSSEGPFYVECWGCYMITPQTDTRREALEAWNTRAETPQSIPSEREEIVTYLKACTPSREFHDSDFSQGVIRGFEICIAQIEEDHHLSTRQALKQGSAE